MKREKIVERLQETGKYVMETGKKVDKNNKENL